jgi:hypothetical protein
MEQPIQARSNSTLRIATWNVEYASTNRNLQRLALIHAADADIWVLTETQDGLDLGSSYSALHSDPRPDKRPPARWVTIWSRHPLIERVAVRDPMRTAAALYATSLGKVLVYGTVMPWHSDRGPTGAAPNWTEHHRVVPEQSNEWNELRERYADAALCTAGDFNMTLGGRCTYGTMEGRRSLLEGLAASGLACVTRTEHVPHGKLAHPHIDHICVPDRWAAGSRVVEAWPGTIDGVRLSDHSAVVVEVVSDRDPRSLLGGEEI